MTRITIRNLDIHLKGVSLDIVRSLPSQLEDNLINQFKRYQSLIEEINPSTIPSFDLGSIQVNKDTSSSKLAEEIAMRVVNLLITSSSTNKEEEQ
ncbi:MAG: hypothetical protein ACFFBD_10295 [Candidatus Hodarchaeota archaeon]